MAQLTTREIADALTRAREPMIDAIRSAIDDYQVVGVTGPSESGKSKLSSVALASDESEAGPAVVRVNLDGVYSPRHLTRVWLRAIAKALAGPIAFSNIVAMPGGNLWPTDTRRADHKLREVLVDDYEVAVGRRQDRQRSKGGDEEVARALTATRRLAEEPAVVFIDHLESPELSGAFDVRAFLWQLRALSQAMPSLRIVLACRPGAVDLASDREAAFFGDGTWLTVAPPSLDEWLSATQNSAAAERAYRYTEGHFSATLLTLERARNPMEGVDAAFAELAREHTPLAQRSLEHAATLHRLGPAVLRAIARDRGPYEAVTDALSRDIATAARRLELAGLVHHARRGHWTVTNPFVGTMLRNPGDEPMGLNFDLR
jgi:hypothetical protein